MSELMCQYLGIYFECKPQYRDIPKETICCSNTNCFKHSFNLEDYRLLDKYCIDCGSKITLKKENIPTVYGFEYEIKKELNCDIYKILSEPSDEKVIYVLAGMTNYYKLLSDYAPCVIDIVKYNITQIISDFLNESGAKSIIKFLDKYYGQGNYEIKWGYVQYEY